MSSLFSPDSAFAQFLSRLCDLIILNLLYLLTCIPVFTIGAANTALYTVCFRIVRNRENGILKPYFRAFGENFKQSTLIWLFLLFIGVPAFVYFDSFYAMEGAMRYLFVVFLSILLLTVFTCGYVFPLVSQFRNSTRMTLQNALILSLGNLPRTLPVTVINLFPWMMLLAYTDLFIQVSFLWAVLYFSAAAYANSAILWKVFKPYYPEETP